MSTHPAPFLSLGLREPLTRAVDSVGYVAMTPIQAAALPLCLAGYDVIAQAKTGSGKTAAFGLAALQVVDENAACVQALVLAPTRELADQVSTEIRRLGRFMANLRVLTLCGGVPVKSQVASLQTTPHVVVATPGRILDHLSRGHVHLDQLKLVVLDEADRLLDMGFAPQIDEVLRHAPARRQTLLFSATFSDEVRTLSAALQRDAKDVVIDEGLTGGDAVDEVLFVIDDADADDVGAKKTDAVCALLFTHTPTSTLIFCHTRNDVRALTAALHARGIEALALHGELEQHERDDVIVRFSNNSCAVLVATDVAARGIDKVGLDAVISYELPTDADTHLHRIGRTGRAGAHGRAWSLATSAELPRAEAIEAARGVAFARGVLPTPPTSAAAPTAPMRTIRIEGGKKDKLRKGDILGALTGDAGVPGNAIGDIVIGATTSAVAVGRAHANDAFRGLRDGRIKGRRFRCRLLG